MLTEITLDRFKCFNHLYMPLKPLTLIAGVNGAGKSSVIQALLMLVQSCRDKDYDWKEYVVINGDLTDLDNARFLMYNSADADKGTVDVTVENDGEQQISFAITPKQTDRVATCVTEGNLDEAKTIALVEQIFGDIPNSLLINQPILPQEPEQTEARRQIVERQVPNNALYKAWVMSDRWSPDYYVYDMISDVLSNGHSSRMYRRLVQEEALFTEINTYITGDLDKGLFVVSGKLNNGITFERAEEAIDQEIKKLQQEPISSHEIEKVANKFENTFVYSQYKSADRALSLCYYEMIGNIELVNTEPDHYREVTPADLQRVANRLTQERSSSLTIKRIE